MKNDYPTSAMIQTLKTLVKIRQETGEFPGYRTLGSRDNITLTAVRKRLAGLLERGLIEEVTPEDARPTDTRRWRVTRKGKEYL